MKWGKLTTRRLIMLAEQGRSVQHISEKIGCTERDVIERSSEINLSLAGVEIPKNGGKGEAMRPCLYCHKDFLSTGAGNRRCESCNGSAKRATAGVDGIYIGA